MNILFIEGDFWEKSVNEGDSGLPQGKHGYEGDWYKIREPPERWQICQIMHAYFK